MAVTKRIKQGFLRLPLSKKVILLSGALLVFASIMPWYDNRNSVGVGEMYLGVQGPLFLIGVCVLICGAISFLHVFLPLMGKHFFEWRRKSGILAFTLGMQALLLIGIANSIFYHPAFGLAGDVKSLRFGMFLAFASIATLTLSGIFSHGKEKNMVAEDFSSADMEPMMDSIEPIYAEENPHANPYSMPQTYSTTPAYSAPAYSAPPAPAYGASNMNNVDPLTLDPKTRYKMLRAQNRFSDSARGNLWGGQNKQTYNQK